MIKTGSARLVGPCYSKLIALPHCFLMARSRSSFVSSVEYLIADVEDLISKCLSENILNPVSRL
jgi:hypothetical protein